MKQNSIDLSAVKAMVTIYGPRETARRMKLAPGTVLSYCSKYKWRRATGFKRPESVDPRVKDAGDVIRESLETSKEQSTLHLAKYTEKASKAASESRNPLDVARKVRDVAGVYSILWPVEAESELIEGAILVGTAKVTDNPKEIMANAIEAGDVRQELPDAGPAGD